VYTSVDWRQKDIDGKVKKYSRVLVKKRIQFEIAIGALDKQKL